MAQEKLPPDLLPKTRNLETAFQQVRLVCLVAVLGSFTCSGFIACHALKFARHAKEQIYVLADGKAMEAMSANRKDNIPVEARDHIRSFHQYFFTLAPDEQVINANITRALYLADGSAKQQYDNLRGSGYYAGVIAGNINQELAIDSIALDTRTSPSYFRCYGKQKIIRPTSIVTRELITEGRLRQTARSDNNPHGFLIERWTPVSNQDLQVEAR